MMPMCRLGKKKIAVFAKIVEMFKATNGSSHFRAQWYYRAKDTAIKSSLCLLDNKRVFFSEIKNDNPLGCLIEKLNIGRLPLDMQASEKEAATSDCDYYCDMMASSIEVKVSTNGNKSDFEDVLPVESNQKTEMTLLDLYSGCGGMSTGLFLGANAAGVNLITLVLILSL